MITQELLKALFKYDRHTGIFTRKVGVRGRHGLEGKQPGTVTKRGYRTITVLGDKYQESHLAWLYVHGAMPKYRIDHINGDPGDNRIENLREVTPSQNAANRTKIAGGTASGFKGVSWHRNARKWQAQLSINSKQTNLGYFDSPEEAAITYHVAAEKHFGTFYHPDPNTLVAMYKRGMLKTVHHPTQTGHLSKPYHPTPDDDEL